ncbi:hypothetical protein [Rhizobium leguminosarum]|uniref:hypothetical protein n=1 Tax=Rhizobium leguminosarum TaxID=384 RepID=UPI003F97F785
MYVAPWTIFAGLGALDRRELCNLIASFEATTLLSMSMDRITDVVSRFHKNARDADTNAFTRRLKEAADVLFVSGTSERALRIRLWARMAEAFDLDMSLPLSTRKADLIGAGVAFKAAAVIALPVTDDDDDVPRGGFQKALLAVKSIRRPHQDFAFLVAEQARLVAKAVSEAADSGEMSEQLQSELGERIRDHIRSLPPELRDDAMRDALNSGDRAALAVLATGTAAFSIGVGVNLAGFSAYILAAQASAFIPLMSGPAVASTLFMLANPLFSIPAIVGIGYLANRHVNGGQAAKLAAVVAVQLALRGLSAERNGLAVTLNDFRAAADEDFAALPLTIKSDTLVRIARAKTTTGSGLPQARGELKVSTPVSDRFGTYLKWVLSRSSGDAAEVAAVAGLSAGDIIYNAVSIDPMVLAAADFSRAEDIGDIFQFGAFAERIGSMTSAAAAGASNNLRGYVSEQLVAARLAEIGHVVSFPGTSNNPGFDLLVDGVPFQVKCLQSVHGLREHFGKYPRYARLCELRIGGGGYRQWRVVGEDGLLRRRIRSRNRRSHHEYVGGGGRGSRRSECTVFRHGRVLCEESVSHLAGTDVIVRPSAHRSDGCQCKRGAFGSRRHIGKGPWSSSIRPCWCARSRECRRRWRFGRGKVDTRAGFTPSVLRMACRSRRGHR